MPSPLLPPQPIFMSILRKLLVHASRTLDRASRVLVYAAAGTLTLAHLKADIRDSWSTFFESEADINSGFMTWEADVVSRCVHASGRVLVVGSGTGRDVLAFSALGCIVSGVEPSTRAAAHSRRALEQRNVTALVVDGFFEDVTLEGTFDVIVFSWFCYSYMPGSQRRIAALKKALTLLAPGGRILVSCLVNPEPPQTRFIQVQRAMARALGSDWIMEEGDQLRLARPGEMVFRFEHMFVPGEFEREGASAGLSVLFSNREEMMFALQPASILDTATVS